MTSPTVSAESAGTTVFGTLVSDIQSNVSVSGDRITGTLLYLDSGNIASYWGAGNFLVLKFANIPATATSVLVGMNPSQSSGLVEIINDPDKNGVFKVTDNTTQKFKVVTTDGTETVTKEYDLSGLVCNAS